METKTVGQIGYEAFLRAIMDFDLRDAYANGTVREWKELDTRTQDAWRSAAYAILKSQIVTNVEYPPGHYPIGSTMPNGTKVTAKR